MTLKRQRGFSLLELMITIAIGLTLASITFIAMMPMFNRNHVDLAYDTTLMVLRNTRHLAITQSHQYYVNFNPAGFPAGTMQITYQPPAVGGGAAAGPLPGHPARLVRHGRGAARGGRVRAGGPRHR